jgi:flavin reductase (DIM6/NTAB) family NADH-FMN oxidoreductase RutF
MSQLNAAKKIDVPSEHWDRLFTPSACLVMITTVDGEGRINAASFGTCAIASKVMKPPRIAECRSHFECKVE